MKKQVVATVGLLALATAQAQVSTPSSGIINSPGSFQPRLSAPPSTVAPPPTTVAPPPATTSPNRPGDINGALGTSNPNSLTPGFQNGNPNSTINPSLSGSRPPIEGPTPNDGFRTSPRSAIGTPSTGVDTLIEPSANPTLRPGGSINDSRDWERGFGAPASAESGTGARRITAPRPIEGGAGSTSPFGTGEGAQSDVSERSGIFGRTQSDLNATGINTPARINEQPLDAAMSAKIRAELSQTSGVRANSLINPETVRDLRITSQNGRVVLEGMVNSKQERDLVETRARGLQGVTAIENRLRVRESNVGGPGAFQRGGSPQPATSGQSPRNSSDLNDSRPESAPNP